MHDSRLVAHFRISFYSHLLPLFERYNPSVFHMKCKEVETNKDPVIFRQIKYTLVRKFHFLHLIHLYLSASSSLIQTGSFQSFNESTLAQTLGIIRIGNLTSSLCAAS